MPLALPSAAERVGALRLGCRGLRLAPDVNLESIGAACSGYAAADLLALVREASMHAAAASASLPAS